MAIDYNTVYFQFKRDFDITKKVNFTDEIFSSYLKVNPTAKSSIDSYDLVRTKQIYFRNKVNLDIELFNTHKRYYKFHWDPENDNVLVGCACFDSSDTYASISLKNRYISAWYIEDYIYSNIDDTLFEKLSAKFLKSMGCYRADSTRKMGDGGIDFWGTININEINNIHIFQNFKNPSNLHFIGQAKYFKGINILDPSFIREFLGSILLLEYVQAWNLQEILSIKNLPNQYLKPQDPVILLFLTTGYISHHARDIARILGIYIFDIEDISYYLTYIAGLPNTKSEIFNYLDHWLQ